MATVLVIEPHPEVRELLLRIVKRLGHVAIVSHVGQESDWRTVDAVLVEPATEGWREVALPHVRDGAALVCVSIYPPSDETLALDPVAYLQKPFGLVDLERALVGALESTERLPAT